MKGKRKIYVGFIMFVICVPLLAFALVRYAEFNNSTLPFYGDNFTEVTASEAKKVNAFDFINQDGKHFNNAALNSKVWVACFFFTTCPSICPKMISGMGDIQKSYYNDVRLRMVSFTVDPYHDTPGVLKQYARLRNINTRQWNLVTGKKPDLYRYARKELKLMATDGDGGPTDFIHSDRLVLIDQNNYIRGYYDGTEPSEVKKLTDDIRKLLK